MTPTIRVRQGAIHVNSVFALACSPSAILLLCDTRQKYPEIAGYGSSDGEHSVCVSACERTLYVDPSVADAMTEITIAGLDGEWSVVAETGRYDVTISLVRRGVAVELWSDVGPDGRGRG